MAFRKTAKQAEASELMLKRRYVLLVGGSRSGKTFIKVRNMLVRALGKKSRHLEVRRTFKSVKRSIWNDTLPKVFDLCFPELKEDVHYNLNRTDFFLEFRNGSSYWIGGMDDRERMERVLGTEYSTIGLNESSELTFDQREILQTRLAENSGLPLRMWDDCNPPSKKHWTYKLFIEGINPADGKELTNEAKAAHGYLLMNPEDNRENLPDSYFDILDGLSVRKRARFRDGLFSSDTEGALWSNDLINAAQLREEDQEPWMTDAPLTVVALDPNVAEDKKPGEEFTADEAGIVVISKDSPLKNSEGNAVVLADHGGELSASEWAKKAVWAYQYYNANCIVAEKNQGGALVKMALRAEDETVPVELVTASKGKHTRAEPVVTLYENGKIKHIPGLDKLESELLEWVPGLGPSPNRLDALVWGASYLFLDERKRKRRSANAMIL
jgi:phage terminase large subunit-like protein